MNAGTSIMPATINNNINMDQREPSPTKSLELSPPPKSPRLHFNDSPTPPISMSNVSEVILPHRTNSNIAVGFINGKSLHSTTIKASGQKHSFSTFDINTLPSNKLLIAKKHLEAVILSTDVSSVTTENKARLLTEDYRTLDSDDKAQFLRSLAMEYGANQESVIHAACLLASSCDKEASVIIRAEEKLKQTLQARYYKLFTIIGRLENGVKFLVDLRADLMDFIQSYPLDNVNDLTYLRVMTNHLRELLSLWFSVGFLQLERVTWNSSCEMLEKISEYEAVHPIRNWTDLKRRVGNYRRCFVFTHASMPREPIVVLHMALTSDILSSIQEIVQRNTLFNNNDMGNIETVEDVNTINTAIFYSITSTQKGLQGVELGNYLIKKVVKELQIEFPYITKFSSLSPIPGFRDWLLSELDLYLKCLIKSKQNIKPILTMNEQVKIHETFAANSRENSHIVFQQMISKASDTSNWLNNEIMKNILMKLCARYLFVEKRHGYALNPVANFHLRNGAVLWRINWNADVSNRGVKSSCSIMVNYRYFLDNTEMNSNKYMENHEIIASKQIDELLLEFKEEHAT